MNWEPLRTCPGPGSSSELRGTQSQEALEGLPLMESSLDLAPLGVPNSSLCPIGELSRILETDSCRCCRNHRNADSSLTSGRWPQLHGLWLSPALHLDRNLVSLLLLWYLQQVRKSVNRHTDQTCSLLPQGGPQQCKPLCKLFHLAEERLENCTERISQVKKPSPTFAVAVS